VKINDPQGGADFYPRAIILTILVEVYQKMPYAKYLSSRPFCLFKKIFSIYSYNSFGCHGNKISALNNFGSPSPKINSVKFG
jgi:hypothetical protein